MPRRPPRICSAAVACSIALWIALPVRAATQPKLSIVREHWRSSSGACTVDLDHATVTGLPTAMTARMDRVLASLLRSQAPSAASTSRERELACAKRHHFSSYENADWITGLAQGRWLSARIHASGYASGAVHPWDGYAAVTFDLEHGGDPVPTSGFYTNARRAKLDQILANAEIAHLDAEDGKAVDADRAAYVRRDVEMSALKASDFFLTRRGVEVTGITTVDAEGRQIIEVPYSVLRGVGTPGGPLDAATR
jgi:hypothetical protein